MTRNYDGLHACNVSCKSPHVRKGGVGMADPAAHKEAPIYSELIPEGKYIEWTLKSRMQRRKIKPGY